MFHVEEDEIDPGGCDDLAEARRIELEHRMTELRFTVREETFQIGRAHSVRLSSIL